MSNSLNDQKKRWARGFRDANSGQVLRGFDLETEVLLSYGIPKSLASKTLDEISPANEKQLMVMNHMYDMINDWRNTPLTMIVSGGNGTGKSLMGAALIHTLALMAVCGNCRDLNPRFTDEAGMTMRLSGFDNTSSFTYYTKVVGVLVVDEFAMTQWSATDKKRNEQILGIRFGNNLKTVLLTNRTSDELFGSNGKEPILSSQLRSRYGSGYLVELNGPDYRRNREALDRALDSGGQSEDWLF